MSGGQARLDRRAVIARLLLPPSDRLVISGLGGTSWDVASTGDHPHYFYLWGGMGSAVALGLGLALAQPERRILVVTGDGEMLMGVGSFATVAAQSPANLAIVVIDNERYGETGAQLTHTALGTDLAAMARGAGIAETSTLTTMAEIESLRLTLDHQTTPILAVIKVAHDNPSMVLPPRDGVYLKHRFRQVVLGEA